VLKSANDTFLEAFSEGHAPGIRLPVRLGGLEQGPKSLQLTSLNQKFDENGAENEL